MKRSAFLFVYAALAVCSAATVRADQFMPTPLPKAGQYSSPSAWLNDRGLDLLGPVRVTGSDRQTLADCVWAEMQKQMLQMDLDDLQSYVRGDFPISPQTKGAMIPILQPLVAGDFSQLQSYCPDKIAKFKAAAGQ